MEPVALTPTIDWRQLEHWRIDPVVAAARDRTSDSASRRLAACIAGYIVSAIALILVQSTLISALLVQRTRRRRAESALRESEAHFRTMADTAPVLIWRSGIDKSRDFVNLPWLRFTGRGLAQELGHGWAECVHPDDLAQCLASFDTAFDARQAFRAEYRLRRFDGDYRWMLDTGVPRWESNHVFAGYIGSCLDITDRREAEVALQETHAELSRVSRLTALGEFAASIAHEVRQPLTAIILNARSCLHDIASTPADLHEVRAGLLDVVDAAQRAEAVIQRNRELFRNHPVQTATLDINGVIKEAIELVGRRLTENHVTLATALAEHLPVISGDRIELQQVLLNLIANAIDAMEDVEPRARQIQVGSAHSRLRSEGHGHRQRHRAARRGRQSDVQVVLHDESQRHGCRAGDQPVDHRGPRRPTLGRTEHQPGRDVLFHAAHAPAGRRRTGAEQFDRVRACASHDGQSSRQVW